MHGTKQHEDPHQPQETTNLRNHQEEAVWLNRNLKEHLVQVESQIEQAVPRFWIPKIYVLGYEVLIDWKLAFILVAQSQQLQRGAPYVARGLILPQCVSDTNIYILPTFASNLVWWGLSDYVLSRTQNRFVFEWNLVLYASIESFNNEIREKLRTPVPWITEWEGISEAILCGDICHKLWVFSGLKEAVQEFVIVWIIRKGVLFVKRRRATRSIEVDWIFLAWLLYLIINRSQNLNIENG